MRVYHKFILVPGSRSTFPDADADPAKWYGSDRIRIRIRNTVQKYSKLEFSLQKNSIINYRNKYKWGKVMGFFLLQNVT